MTPLQQQEAQGVPRAALDHDTRYVQYFPREREAGAPPVRAGLPYCSRELMHARNSGERSAREESQGRTAGALSRGGVEAAG